MKNVSFPTLKKLNVRPIFGEYYRIGKYYQRPSLAVHTRSASVAGSAVISRTLTSKQHFPLMLRLIGKHLPIGELGCPKGLRSEP